MIIDVILGYIIPFFLLIIAGVLLKSFRDNNVIKWANMAVKTAEQMFEHEENNAKFEYVKCYIKEKFNISDTDLKNIIESAVYEINKEK